MTKRTWITLVQLLPCLPSSGDFFFYSFHMCIFLMRILEQRVLLKKIQTNHISGLSVFNVTINHPGSRGQCPPHFTYTENIYLK